MKKLDILIFSIP